MSLDQAYVVVVPSPTVEPARARPRRVCRSERERLARRLSIAMTLAGWSDGMLARALDVCRSFARKLRVGEKALNDAQIAALLRFDRLADALRRVGLAS